MQKQVNYKSKHTLFYNVLCRNICAHSRKFVYVAIEEVECHYSNLTYSPVCISHGVLVVADRLPLFVYFFNFFDHRSYAVVYVGRAYIYLHLIQYQISSYRHL